MSPSRFTRVLAFAGAFSALLCLVGCAGGSATDPSPAPGAMDTYFFATVTVLDDADFETQALPCDSFDCQPEFYDCRTRQPYFVGDSWQLFGDLATSGILVPDALLSPATSPVSVAMTATDVTTQVGVAIEFQFASQADPGASVNLVSGPTVVNGVFANIQLTCDQVNTFGVPESRFEILPAEPFSLTLASWELNPSGFFQIAESAGGNQFSPSGILEGSFSFVGRNVQATAADEKFGYTMVEGCFRLNVPIDERGVPTNPDVASALCRP